MIFHSARHWLLVGLAILLLSACASMEQDRKLEETLLSYENTIRWESLIDASKFQKNPQPVSEQQRRRMKSIKITGYDVIKSVRTENEAKLRVEIRYYDERTAIERSIIDEQIWKLDENTRTWQLMTPLPKFI